jgi:hypothetical protein
VQEAAVSVPLLRPDQSGPRSGGPVGRLRRLLNGIVQKHRPDGSVKVEKRTGFHLLSSNVSNVTDGNSLGNLGVPGTTLIGTLGDELVQIGKSVPYVYAPSAPSYKKFPHLVMTETAFRRVVHAGTQSISRPDGARVGSIACYTWVAGGACYAQWIDLATDTPIRTAVQIATAGRIKVVADGVRFWLYVDNASTTVTVYAYGTDGVGQGNAAATLLTASTTPWDVTAMPGVGNGSVIASNAAVGVDYVRLAFATYSAGNVVITGPVFNQYLPSTYGISWLRNDFDPNRLYLATSTVFNYTPPGPDPVRNIGIYVGRMQLNGTHDVVYPIVTTLTQDEGRTVMGLTGYVASASRDLYLSWGRFARGVSTPGARMNSTTTSHYASAPGSSTLLKVQRSVSLAGRVFKLGTRYVIPTYYASISQEGAQATLAVPVAQPTYFLVDVVTQDIVGRFEYGTAAMDWAFNSWNPVANFGPGFHWMPSTFDDANGIVHWTAGYVANVETSQVVDPDLGGPPVNKAVPIAAIADIRLGGRGVPVELETELLIPGPRAVSFSRDDFTMAGFELGAEAPYTGPQGIFDAGGIFAAGETHRYGIVYSALDTAGNKIRSIASITTAPLALTGAQTAFQLVIPYLRMTMHAKVLIEIYRDVWDATNHLAGSQLRKITVDEQSPGDTRAPYYNDPTQDALVFVDKITNDACKVGAPIYTDDGTLDSFACPTFSVGCVFGDRVFVGGYDSRIFYSFSKTPGQTLAFNEDEFFFTVPTSQRVTALVPLDNRLFIFCEKSIWYVDGGDFLSADGRSGSNPIPIELKFKNGCKGRAEAITAGIIYDSSAGGLWLLTRGLENIYIGQNVQDDMAGVTVLDIAIDKDQRIGVLTSNARIIVYDQVTGVWSPWQLVATGVALCSWQGRFTFADNGNGTARQQTDAAYDDDGTFIQTRIDIQDISLADINGFQVIWETSALGEWKGAHTFNVEVTYDGGTTIDETFSHLFDVAVVPFRFDWQPKTIECSAIGLSIYDTLVSGFSQGFTLESLGLYVGVERGAKYQERRISPA